MARRWYRSWLLPTCTTSAGGSRVVVPVRLVLRLAARRLQHPGRVLGAVAVTCSLPLAAPLLARSGVSPVRRQAAPKWGSRPPQPPAFGSRQSGPPRAESLPPGVDDVDAGGAVPAGTKRDLDVGGVGPVAPDVPQVGQPAGGSQATIPPQSISVPSGGRSKIRPPTTVFEHDVGCRGRPTPCGCSGHQVPKRLVHVSKAWSWRQATSTLSAAARSRRLRLGVLGDEPETGGGIAPDLTDEGLHGFDAPVVEPVDAPGAPGLLQDEARRPQQAQVAGHRRRLMGISSARSPTERGRSPSSSTMARRLGSPSAANGSPCRRRRASAPVARRLP